MFLVFKILIFTDFEIFKFETLLSRISVLILKKFRSFTDFKNQDTKKKQFCDI
jgi:hypothetical protein